MVSQGHAPRCSLQPGEGCYRVLLTQNIAMVGRFVTHFQKAKPAAEGPTDSLGKHLLCIPRSAVALSTEEPGQREAWPDVGNDN